MNLGENIYRHRTAQNLSQGDLADALEVSRQSVSKWENNSAVPELDKLMKMAQLFGISLDDLVTGTSGAPSSSASAQAVPASGKTEARTIAAIVFFVLAVISLVIVPYLFPITAIPFAILGVICLIAKKRTALICCWALQLMAEAYFYFNTGTIRTYFLAGLRYPALLTVYPQSVYCLISLILFAGAGAFTIWTVWSNTRSYVPLSKKDKIGLAAGWGVFLLIRMLRSLAAHTGLLTPEIARTLWYRSVDFILSWAMLIFLNILLTFTLRLLLTWRKTKSGV